MQLPCVINATVLGGRVKVRPVQACARAAGRGAQGPRAGGIRPAHRTRNAAHAEGFAVISRTMANVPTRPASCMRSFVPEASLYSKSESFSIRKMWT